MKVPGLIAVWPGLAVALAKVLGPSPRGRRPAGPDKRVRGGYDQLDWSPPFFLSDVIAALGFSL